MKKPFLFKRKTAPSNGQFSLFKLLTLSIALLLLGVGGVRGQTTIVNYDFNSGTSFGSLSPSLATNITSTSSGSETFTTYGGAVSGAAAFVSNSTAGNALGMANSSGTNTKYFQFALGGSALSNYSSFKIYFQAQRSGTGATTATIAYSTNGSSFTNFGTTQAPGNGSFNQCSFDLSLITAINSQSAVYFRVLVSGASGSGTFRMDNFQISATASGPNITQVGTLTSFISSSLSTPSIEQSFTVGGESLTNDIVVTPPTGFQVSTTSGSGFGSSVSLTPSSGIVATTTIYARFNPTALADQAGGNIACTSTGASTKNVAVTGEVTNLSVGAIAFIAFQGVNPDYFRIVALEDIPAYTRIWFTDKAWDGNPGTLAFTSGEGSSVWTSPNSTTAKGTVIEFAVGAGTVNLGTGAFTSGLGSSGEQLFAYQGTLTTPSFITGYTSGTTISTGVPTASGTDTWVPASLTDGTNFMALGTNSGSSYLTTDVNNRSLSDMRSYIHNVSNHTLSSSTTTYSSWPSYTFNIIANEPTTQPSFTAASAIGNNQMTLNFSGGDGSSYLVVMRKTSAVSAVPVDATAYTANTSTIDFTTAYELSSGERIVYNGSASNTSITVTNLAAGSDYYYAIYAYNGNSTTINYLTTSPGTGNASTTGSSNSSTSDIIIHSSFTEPSNIAYQTYQENSDLTSLNSIEVAKFTLRDGGASSPDADGATTTLTAITFDVSNYTLLRRLALYNGSTELAEIAVSSGSAVFSGLSLSAADDGTQDFSLRASFIGNPTDNSQFSFTVNSVTADPTGSTFISSNAGAATSSTTSDRNRIEVTATLLTFVQQPSSTTINTAISPAVTVSANDALGNRDLDYVTDMTATTTGTFGGSSTNTITPVAGLGTFSNLQFSVAGSITINIGSGSLTNTGNSANFTISAGPTTLSAGDVAIVAINSANPDMFSILLLKDITQNTVINFTDNGFTGNDVTGRTGEGFLTFTAPSDYSAGTILTWTNGMSISGTGWSSNAPSNFSFNGSGDQLFIFQGNTANWATQSGITLLFGMNYGIALSGTSAAANTLQPNTSILPATSFLNLGSSTYANAYFSNTGSSSSSVSVCGSSSSVLSSLVNSAKWFGNSSSSATFPSLTYSSVCPTNNWIGSNGNWNNTANWSLSAIPLSTDNITISSGNPILDINFTLDALGALTISGTGALTINPTKTLTIAGTADFGGKSVTIKSDASGTGSIGKITGTLSNASNITVETFIPAGKRAYRLMGHPFNSPMALSSLIDNIHITGTGGASNGFDPTTSNNPSAFSFSESTYSLSVANSGWNGYTNTSNTIAKGEGFRIFFRGPRSQSNLLDGTNPTPLAATLDFTGAINQGTVNTAMSYTSASGTDAGWNLLSNPYPSNIDLGAIASGNRDSISAFSVWVPNNGTRGAYVTISFGSSYIIPASSAFFVQTGSAANFTFTEADKTSSAVSATLLKTDPLKLNAIQINVLSDDTLFWDQFVLRNRPEASDARDVMDAAKLQNPDVNFYSLSSSNEKFAIDHRPVAENKVVNLGFETTSDYHFTFKVASIDIPEYDVYLMDKFLNKQTLLSANTSYNFSTTSDANSKGNARFQLVFTKNANGAEELGGNNNFVVYPNPASSQINVALSNARDGIYTYSLINQMGQELNSGDLNLTANSIQTLNIEELSYGVYFLKITNGQSTQTIKFIK
jgi:hypothetical protein